jgi:hypothetical protein
LFALTGASRWFGVVRWSFAHFERRLKAIVRTPPGPHGLLEGVAVSVVLACAVYFLWLCWGAGRELSASRRPAAQSTHKAPERLPCRGNERFKRQF